MADRSPRLPVGPLPAALATLLLAATASGAPLALQAGMRGETAAGGSGAATELGVAWRAFERVDVDVWGRTGYLLGADGGDTAYLALLAGPTWRLPLNAGTALLSLRFAHIHHAPAGSWVDHPVGNLFGDSSGEVKHRSGAELAAGWLGGPVFADDPALRWRASVTAGALPSSDALAWTAGLTVGVDWALGG